MGKFTKVYRCKRCSKIYPIYNELPIVCGKCGADIGTAKLDIPFIPGAKISFDFLTAIKVVPTENCEIITAKRKLFKWEVFMKNEDSYKEGEV